MDRIRLDQVEQIVQALPGVVSARATATANGDLDSLQVRISDRQPRHHITRAIHAALLIYLDLTIDEDQISVTVTHEAAPIETNGFHAPSGNGGRGSDEHGPESHGEAHEVPSAEAEEGPAAETPASEQRKPVAELGGPGTWAGDPAGSQGPSHEPEPTPALPRQSRESEDPSAASRESEPASEPTHEKPAAAEEKPSSPQSPQEMPSSAGKEPSVGEDEPRSGRSEPSARPSPPSRAPGDRFRLVGYAIDGGATPGLRVRVRIQSDGRTTEAAVPVEGGLDSVSLEIFAEAAVISAERALEKARTSDDVARPGLKVAAIDRIRVRDQAYLAVSVSGPVGERRRALAAGFAAIGADSHRAAVLATLDGVTRLVRGELPGTEAPSSEIEPFEPWS